MSIQTVKMEDPNKKTPEMRCEMITTKKNLFLLSDLCPSQIIKISRSRGDITSLSSDKIQKLINFQKKNTYQRLKVHGFFGIITIHTEKVLLMVTKAQQVADFRGRPILKVTEVHGKIIIKNCNQPTNGEKMIVIMENIRKYLKKGFYFSFFYDLLSKFPVCLQKNQAEAEPVGRPYGTVLNLGPGNALQNDGQNYEKYGSEFGMLNFKKQQSQGDEVGETLGNQKKQDLVTSGDLDLMFANEPANKTGNTSNSKETKQNSNGNGQENKSSGKPHDRVDYSQESETKCLNTKYASRVESIFAWNLNACRDFFDSPNFPENSYSFFPPFIQGHVGNLRVNENIALLLITRRSYIMGGTRYNSRGINPSGFVSNFAESEQIIDLGPRVYSYLQIRGSVPFFWDQKKVGREVTINQTENINQQVFPFLLFLLKFHLKLCLYIYLKACFLK